MHMVFLSGKITVVRHLVDANVPLKVRPPLKGILPGILYQNDYNNLENKTKTSQLFVIWNRHLVVHGIDILVIDY